MKSQLTERSERKLLAECDPTPSSEAMAMPKAKRNRGRETLCPSGTSVLLGVGFNSDKTSYVALRAP